MSRAAIEARLADVERRKQETLRAEIEATLKDKRTRARRHLIPWTQLRNPRYKAGKFHRHLAARLEAFSAAAIAGESPRVILCVPPQHGKSELGSRSFPGWHLSRAPHHRIILASYAADLASQMSIAARSAVEEAATWVPELAHDGSKEWTSDLWTLNAGGGLRSAGVGGGITGMSAHVGIIDDPVKDESDARSPAFKRRFESWYETAFKTRIQDGGGILVISTRWGVGDPIGYLLARELESGGRPWEVIRYPAIAEADEYDADGSLWRAAGEVLSPERYSLATMLERKGEMAPWRWAALYQQQPVPEEGGIFRPEHFSQRYTTLPELDGQAISVDLTFKGKDTSDFVVMQCWGWKGANCYLIDQRRGRMFYPESKAALIDFRAKHPRASTVIVEDKANGSAMVSELRPMMPGIIGWDPGKADKRTRAEVSSLPRYAAGQVFLPASAGWMHDFVTEHLGFLAGAANDDQVDAESQFFAWLGSRSATPITARSFAAAFGAING